MSQLIFKKYKRVKNFRRNSPVARVLKGYFHFNKQMTASLRADKIDLFVDSKEEQILVKPGNDFKLTFANNGRATFSAGPFLREYGIEDGFYPAQETSEGLIFRYRIDTDSENTIKIEK